MNKKQVALALLALFIGLIFLSSYFTLASLNTSGTTTTTTKTVTPPETVFGVADTNAIISGYNTTFNILTLCSNGNSTAAMNKVGSIIANLEQNNSVYNSYTIGSNTVIESGNMDTYSIYQFFKGELNATTFSCLNFTTATELTLPPALNVKIGNSTYTLGVPPDLRNTQTLTTLSPNMSASVPVRVSALVTSNGTIYSLSVTRLATSAATTSNTMKTTTSSNTITANSTTSNTISTPSNTVGTNTMKINSTTSNSMTTNTLATGSSNTVTTNTIKTNSTSGK